MRFAPCVMGWKMSEAHSQIFKAFQTGGLWFSMRVLFCSSNPFLR